MIFDVDYDGAGFWMDYNEEVRVKIRPITKKLMRDFRKKATTKKGFRGAGDVNENAYDSAIFEHAIEDWEGIVIPSGEKLECNSKNIGLVVGRLINFSAWVIEASMSCAENAEVKLAEEIKN